MSNTTPNGAPVTPALAARWLDEYASDAAYLAACTEALGADNWRGVSTQNMRNALLRCQDRAAWLVPFVCPLPRLEV